MRTDWEDIIADLFHRLAEVERRLQNQRRTGTIESVDAARGVARVRLGESPDGKPFLTAEIPWKTASMGATKINVPPSIGQQVEVVSESGDMTDAIIDNSVRSNANPLPAAEPGETKHTTGDTTLLIGPGKFEVVSPVIVLNGTVYQGGPEGSGKLVHRKDDLDNAGDLAVGSASKVYAA